MAKHLKITSVFLLIILIFQILFTSFFQSSAYADTEAAGSKTSGEKDIIRQIASECTSPIIINEVVVSPYGENYSEESEQNYDWVEIKNRSKKDVRLSDYCLTDDYGEMDKYTLPDVVLEAGQFYVIACDEESPSNIDCTGFSLSADKETLYLSYNGSYCDALYIKNVPLGGSCGRQNDNTNETVYFESPTKALENGIGCASISKKPQNTGTAEGVYNDIESLVVEFSGKGTLYYTTDGSRPTIDSTEYTGPITITKTTVFRVISVEDGCLPSYPLTQSFIINENLTMPVLSLVTDDPEIFIKKYNTRDKTWEMPCNLAFLVEDGFNIDCGTCVAGWGSLYELYKRNLNVYFRSAYGKSNLKYDFFGTGVQKYSTLSLRGGSQDASYRFYTDDIWEDLTLQMDADALTQHTKPCILFVNGEYWGIFNVKENISRAWFAEKMGVSKSSVEKVQINQKSITDEFKDNIIKWAVTHDMSVKENYDYICSLINIDSFIEWVLVQGISGNPDHTNNVAVYRSTELDGKWCFPIYDLDHAVPVEILPWDKLWLEDNVFGWSNSYVSGLFKALIENDEFKDQLLTAYAKCWNTVFSQENVLALSKYYRDLYEPEAERNCHRWYYVYNEWIARVDYMDRRFIEHEWNKYGVLHLCKDYLLMSDEEIAHYFNF